MSYENAGKEQTSKMYSELRQSYERLLEIFVSHSDNLIELTPIRLNGSRLSVDSVVLNLRDKPLTLKLVSVFLSSTAHKVCKKFIMQEMYGADFYTRYSSRYIEGKEQNIIKLIMRARNLFKTYFSLPTADSKWFSYNLLTEEWTLLER